MLAAATTRARVSCTVDVAAPEGETLTLSGSCSKILTVVGQHADATANFAVAKTSDLVLTFDIEATTDGTTNDTTGAELLLVVV